MEGSLWYKLRILSLLLVVSLFTTLTAVAGFIGHFFYWLIFDVFIRIRQQTNHKIKLPKEKNKDEYYALIIGAGYSGVGIAIKLKELGTSNFIVIERHGHVGGTWYANRYPGCACDVPSNLYSFSFEPNPEWSRFYSKQPEIGKYLEHCTNKYDISQHIHFNTTVTQLKWINDKQIWQVTTQSNNQEKQVYARFIMAGYGLLSNASYPTDISDIDKFEGQMCHTAEWNEAIDFKNKRVAVIGTGSSAIQCVPQIEKIGVKELLIFQRTAPWVMPLVDRAVTEWEKKILARFPIIQKFLRGLIYWIYESLVFSFVYRLPIRFVTQELAKYNLARQIKDKELRKKLTPTWDLGCKRILFSNDWYSTIQRPNVKIVANRIKKLTANSIVTYDDDEYQVDIIIWSTGFRVQKFPLTVYGVNGHSLVEQWTETMQVGIDFAYKNMYLIGIYSH
jgi:cation diffusion facilitator CzcD-associated flavoprotein CzcO